MGHFHESTSNNITQQGDALILGMEKGYAKDFTIITTKIPNGDANIIAHILISGDGTNYQRAIDNNTQTNIEITDEGVIRIENLPSVFIKIDVQIINGTWKFQIIGV